MGGVNERCEWEVRKGGVNIYEYVKPSPTAPLPPPPIGSKSYARRMGQPTQRATNYTARSNIDTAQIFLHANGQRPKRAPTRQRSRRRQRRREPHTEDGLGVPLTALAQHISHSHSGIDEKRPTVKFVDRKKRTRVNTLDTNNYIHTSNHIYTFMYIHISISISIYLSIYLYLFVSISISVYIYIYTHTYI